MNALEADPTRYVPHRPPFLAIDRVLAAEAQRAVAERLVAPGPELEQGALWEPALIEGLAQTAAVLAARWAELEGRALRRGLLVGLRRLELSRPARAGERVRFEATLLRRLEPLVLVRGEARVGEELLASGELKFFLEGSA